MPGNVIFIEGFDAYNGVGAGTGAQSRGWSPSNGNTTLQAGRWGGQCYATDPSGTGVSVITGPVWGSSVSTFAFGTAVQYDYGTMAGGYCALYLVRQNINYQLGFRFETNGQISVYRLTAVNAGTLLGQTAFGVLLQNTWHYLEGEIVISDTVGEIRLYVDSTLVLNLSGIDTNNSGGDVNSFYFAGAGSGFSLNTYFDDMYVTDTAVKLGERKVETIRPNADSTPLQLTPSTGTTHYNLVNATVAQSVTYNSGATVGLTDVYDLSNLSSTPATVDAVQIGFVGNKTDAGTKQASIAVDDGAGLTYGTPQTLLSAVTFMQNRRLMNAKPGGGAWSYAAVNSLKAGLRIEV